MALTMVLAGLRLCVPRWSSGAYAARCRSASVWFRSRGESPVTSAALSRRAVLRRGMDRQGWLAERRAAVIAAYDGEAATYGDHEYPSDMQQEWVGRVLRRIPPGGVVLDAPCGTGKYFPLVAAAGHRVAGVDQSAGMLSRAQARGIAFSLDKRALQDLSHEHEFDAALTVDAMENIPPEDWPLVLAKVHRAVRPGGLMYLTVEEVGQSYVDWAFARL